MIDFVKNVLSDIDDRIIFVQDNHTSYFYWMYCMMFVDTVMMLTILI